MTKEQLQDIVYRILGETDVQAQVAEVTNGVAKLVVLGRCGGTCGCSNSAFETLKSQIPEQHPEITAVERIV